MSVRDGYAKCVSGEVTICNSSLLKARKVETVRVANASSSNAVRVQASLNNATRCANAHAKAIASVSAWQAFHVHAMHTQPHARPTHTARTCHAHPTHTPCTHHAHTMHTPHAHHACIASVSA